MFPERTVEGHRRQRLPPTPAACLLTRPLRMAFPRDSPRRSSPTPLRQRQKLREGGQPGREAAQDLSRTLEPLSGEAGQSPRRCDKRGRHSRPQLGHDPAEREEVAARGGCHGDDARQALDVFCRRPVVPDGRSGSGLGDSPGGVAPVGAEHEVTTVGRELLVDAGGPLWLRLVVDDLYSDPGASGPQLHSGTHLRALDRVASCQRGGRRDRPSHPSPWARQEAHGRACS